MTVHEEDIDIAVGVLELYRFGRVHGLVAIRFGGVHKATPFKVMVAVDTMHVAISEVLDQAVNGVAITAGNAVEVKLHVAPGDTGVFFEIKEVMVPKSSPLG